MMIRVVTTIYPFPTNTGGKRRIVTVLEAFLRAGHRVELVVITKKNEQLDRTELPENIDLAIFYQTNCNLIRLIIKTPNKKYPIFFAREHFLIFRYIINGERNHGDG